MQDPAQGQHSLPVLIYPEDQLFRITVWHGIRRAAVHDDDVAVAQLPGIAVEISWGDRIAATSSRVPKPQTVKLKSPGSSAIG